MDNQREISFAPEIKERRIYKWKIMKNEYDQIK